MILERMALMQAAAAKQAACMLHASAVRVPTMPMASSCCALTSNTAASPAKPTASLQAISVSITHATTTSGTAQSCSQQHSCSSLRGFASQGLPPEQQAPNAGHASVTSMQDDQQPSSSSSSTTTTTTETSAGNQPHNSSVAGQGIPAGSPADNSKAFMEAIAPHMMDSRSKAPLMSSQYASSADDKYGVQKNWFTSLYKQLNYLAKTGSVPVLKDRQREIFEEVERQFEGLYQKYIQGQGHDEDSHRALLMCCLSVATYRVLNQHIEDTRLVRDLIRTNLGSVMLALLKPLHRAKLWIYSWLLREDMYQEAVKFLPALQRDMGALCNTHMEQQGPDETTLSVTSCKYYDVLTQEDTPFLLSEFCCHHALMWMHEFRRHGVVVSMDQCKAWDDQCCQIRLARTGHAANQQPPTSA